VGAHEIDGKTFVFLGHPLHAAETEITDKTLLDLRNQAPPIRRGQALGFFDDGLRLFLLPLQ
jgi:hypothetical protein